MPDFEREIYYSIMVDDFEREREEYSKITRGYS